MGLLDRVRDVLLPEPARKPMASGLRAAWEWMTYQGGLPWPLVPGVTTTYPELDVETIDGSAASLARTGYKGNAVVFACMDAHRRLFSEATFQYQRVRDGQPGDLFGDRSLSILEVPWPNGTTGDLLSVMINRADWAGNWYGAIRAGYLATMRPDWTEILLDAPASDLDARIVGYRYWPDGRHSGATPVLLPVDEVAHFAPIPDPEAPFMGMSWLTPLVREIMADSAATSHKLQFFKNGATPNMLVKRSDEVDQATFDAWVAMMESGHTGVANAYRTLYLTAGADATVIGANLRQLDFANVQGRGETRIASDAGVPPIIVGLSEGLQAATYSNYGQARRAFADLWARPMWRNAAASLAKLVNVPRDARLWYDDRHIPFLAEDQKDQADIESVKAQTVSALITAGYKPDAVVKAVDAADLSLLVGQHTGLYSVQLQPPGTVAKPAVPAAPDDEPPADEPAPANGRVPEPATTAGGE